VSRIDDLIRDLCPDGAEYKPLGEILNYEQPGPYLVSSKEYNLSYLTPVLTAGATFILGYTNEQHGIYSASQDSPAIIFDDFTTACKWVDFPFKAKSSAMKILTSSSGNPVDLRYTYYVLEALNYTPSTHSRHWISVFSNMQIAFPPRKVREYIVSTLNRFKALEAELEAELEARQQQYAYYRDILVAPRSSRESVKLGEVSHIARGASPRPIRNFITNNDGIPWIKIGDVPPQGKYVTNTAQHISTDGAEKSRQIKPGDFILSNSMSFGRPYISKINGCIHDGWLVISNYEKTFDPDFLYHVLRSTPIQNEFAQRAGSGTVRNLNSKIVSETLVPAPPIDQQREIVHLLDKFDLLVNDLTSGLPAEIEARRKQYEYYRDRLLTFPEKK